MKALRFLVTVSLVSLFAMVFIFSPDKASAIVRSSNTNVFTGRFIPAFLGGAYDPSAAFSELAGLPVYVFAYDFWNGANPAGQNSWIISDIAVRSQVRADGSFQVQGLPVASHYGVYFPFELQGGKVVRTDCTPDDQTTNPCQDNDNRDYLFRMPVQEDKIVDVFSYAGQYLTTPVVIQSQVANNGIYEDIQIKHAFVTNRTEVDIANNINTFPLVPNTTLKISIEDSENVGAEYEVYAIRLARESVFGESIIPVEFPIIKGRTVESSRSGSVSSYVFQSFAPQGSYAIIVWRRENKSPTYDTWDGESTLNSQKYQVAYQLVQVGGTNLGDSSDWRNMLAQDNKVYVFNNRMVVWGMVYTGNGLIFSSKNTLTVASDPVLRIKSDSEKDYVSYYKEDNPTDYNDVPFIYSGAVPGSTHGPVTVGTHGFYSFMMDYLSPSTISDAVTVNIDNESLINTGDPATGGYLQKYQKGTRTVGPYLSINGPIRVDINTGVSSTGRDGGHDSGIFVKALLPNGELASGARMTIKSNSKIGVPAELKVYPIDSNGEGFIPYSELTYRGVPGSAHSYLIRVQLDPHIIFAKVLNTDFNQGEYVSREITLNTVTVRGPSSEYNLAALNDLKDFIMPNTVNAAGITLEHSNPYNIQVQGLTGDAFIYVYRKFLGIGGLLPCGNDSCVISTDVGALTRIRDKRIPPNGEVYVHLPKVLTQEVVKKECEGAIGNVGVDVLGEVCDRIAELSVQAQSYVVEVKSKIDNEERARSVNLSVDSSDNVIPASPLIISLAYDCTTISENAISSGRTGWWEKVGDTVNVFAHIKGYFAGIACSAGDFFIKNIPGALGLINKYGLQTRALTQDKSILQIADVFRNIVNIIFVFIFIIAAIMTILRYQPEQWHIRVLLPKLLLNLVLANFSVLIIQAMLDLNNFASSTLFNFTIEIITSGETSIGTSTTVGTAAIGAGAALMGSLGVVLANFAMGLLTTILAATAGTGGVATLFAIIGLVLVVIPALMIQVAGILLVLLSRYAVIWILAAIGPVAFGLSVLPWFSGYDKKWFDMVVKVSVIQTAVAGIMSIAILLLILASVEDAVFSGIGVVMVAMVMFYMAYKLPFKMMSSLGVSTKAFEFSQNLGAKANKFVSDKVSGAITSKGEQDEEYAHRFGKVPEGGLGKIKYLGHRALVGAGKSVGGGIMSAATGGAYKDATKYSTGLRAGFGKATDSGRDSARDEMFARYSADSRKSGVPSNLSKGDMPKLIKLFNYKGDFDFRTKREGGVANLDPQGRSHLSFKAGLTLPGFIKQVDGLEPNVRNWYLNAATRELGLTSSAPPATPPAGGGTPTP